MKQFRYNGKSYEYRRDDLQCQLGERCIEVPIAIDILSQFKYGNIIEVGNVLQKYINSHLTVIDKYDTNDGCINLDVLEYIPQEKPDLIISISTIEHIGFDMGESNDPSKIPKFFEWVGKVLPIGGELFFTFPIGYNPTLDAFVQDNIWNMHSFGAMKRISQTNEWQECDLDWSSKYGEPYEYGNMVFIGRILK
jgi:hypothetical protein